MVDHDAATQDLHVASLLIFSASCIYLAGVRMFRSAEEEQLMSSISLTLEQFASFVVLVGYSVIGIRSINNQHKKGETAFKQLEASLAKSEQKLARLERIIGTLMTQDSMKAAATAALVRNNGSTKQHQKVESLEASSLYTIDTHDRPNYLQIQNRQGGRRLL